MQVIIEKMNHQAQGIGKINNKVIFIPKTIIGDIVDVSVIEGHKNYSKGKLNSIIKPSSDRRDALCPYYDICGGCNISTCSKEYATKYKIDKVIDIFKRKMIDISPKIITADNTYHYRNKITLQVIDNKVGLFMESSNNIVKIDKCLLVSAKINKVIEVINEKLDIHKCTKIVLRENDHLVMAIFYGVVEKNSVINILGNLVDSIYIYDKDYRGIYGCKYIYEVIDKYKYRISPDSFFQVNSYLVKDLYDCIKEYALNSKCSNLVDLYCGTGTISLYLSKYFKSIIGIEINHQAIMDARYNAIANGVDNIIFYEGDVSKLISDNYKDSVIVVDPPRSGLDKHTKDVLLRLKAKMIVYTSCNPITLVRDICDLGSIYELDSITLVDMFPNTYHVECVCLLKIK